MYNRCSVDTDCNRFFMKLQYFFEQLYVSFALKVATKGQDPHAQQAL